MKKSLLSVLAIFLVVSSAVVAEEAVFHAKFHQAASELEVTIPSHVIEPTIKSHFTSLQDLELSAQERDLYLEMYLRDTITLQYGAFPMALGESGVVHKAGKTTLVMKLAKLPEEARELIVQINSFAQLPQQNNLFQITNTGDRRQQVALSSRNAFSASLYL